MHSAYFHETMSLAKKGRGSVFPNPEVGCVIVKDGKVIGRGWHTCFGKAHAEVEAVKNAEENGYSVKGSDVYVSLEPCSHTKKKTPPCTDLLIAKQVQNVYILFQDPNPLVSGNGKKKLEWAQVHCEYAPKEIQHQYADFYEIFTHYIVNKSGFWTLKLAQTRNGFLGEQNKRLKITGEECRKYTLEKRDMYQAILVGVQTVIADNPTLSGVKTQPLRIVLDPKGKLVGREGEYQFFRNDAVLHVVLSDTEKCGESVYGKNRVICKEKEPGVFDLVWLKKYLEKMNIYTVFVEGGGCTAREMRAQNVLNTAIFYEGKGTVDVKNGVRGMDYENDEGFCERKSWENDDGEKIVEGFFL